MSLDIFQQTFCLGMAVNSAAHATGSVTSLQQQLQQGMNDMLSNPNFTSGWELAPGWLPAVWQSPYSSVIDQALAVTTIPPSGGAPGYYVVSIAATSPASPFMVYLEDMAVSPVYMQSNPAAGGGTLSYGNYVALQALLNLTSNGKTLGAYLASVASPDYNLVFCGHSLGGGLTPLLAYALYPGGTAGQAASNKWQNIYTYPTAGPTTADSTFRAAYNAAFKVVVPPGNTTNAKYWMWNANMYNQHDVVPNAWANSTPGPNLSNITAGTQSGTSSMFYTNLEMSVDVMAMRTVAQNMVAPDGSNSPYSQINNNGWFTAAQSQGQITSVAMLGTEILYQHIEAYLSQYGVTAIFPNAPKSAVHPALLSIAKSLAGSGNAASAASAG